MLSSVVQPATVSVFSSTGTEPLKLFGTRIDASLPSDSFVHLLHDRLSQPLPPLPAALIVPPPLCDVEEGGKGPGYSLDQTVLHIQSPTLPTTYIQCPAAVPTGSLGARDLGIKHPWIHLQVRNLGREWSFEVGLVDQSGRVGVLRLSTFQKQPRLKLNQKKSAFPLLHLPLVFPSRTSRPLTAWTTISLNLPSFLPYFSSTNLINPNDDNIHAGHAESASGYARNAGSIGTVPSGSYSHVSYVRVHATCRLRRIWFGESGPTQNVLWEFELYSDE
ncbi:hypothetical protein BDQ12DRAFT_684571 [Crucibulum laeve]|uniref:CFA20 domain-containing protein n=1 Tax=Crucibulum laeve TaxID=68775 RepID=A0A5C3LY51_9AGAR|nr:hypothetical protein BDQ12DRAFT_684571 [Crucibulum laeve]